MRTRLFASVSWAAILLGASAAHAATGGVPAGEAVLRGAYDINDGKAASAPAPVQKAKRLALTAQSPEEMSLSTMDAWRLTAEQIATTAFAWTSPTEGAGVVIGIVDSGIDLDHPEFKGRVLTGTCLGYSICTATGAMKGGDPGVYSSQKTHGTHVAGIAAGATVGLAQAAKILPVKVCDTYSSSCPGDVDGGIVWASTHGAKVINVSLGGPGLYVGDINAAARAIANGAVLVVAAGNAGASHPVAGFLGGAALKPGVRGGMIVVGATGTGNRLASFSQTPGSTCETYSGHSYCMRDFYVVAPGQGIKSSVGGGGYAGMSGTSMATPYVSGVAAIVKGAWPTLTPFQVADIIFRTATDLGTPGPDDVYGRGAVNVTAAMAPLGTTTTVTSGVTTTTATGTTSTLSTSSLGVLSAPLQSSNLLKGVLAIDEYGRDFKVDMTKLAQTKGFSLTSLLRDPFRSLTPIALTQTGAFGTVSMSGFVETPKLPETLNANAALQGSALNSVEHVAVSLSPIEGVSLDFGHNINMSGAFNPYDLRAPSGGGAVFLSGSALNSPYLALADGGNFSGATFAPADGVRVRLGYANVGQNQQPVELLIGRDPTDPANTPSAAPQRQASSVVASIGYDFAPWGGVGLTASRTKEAHSVLGGYTAGAFAIADDAGTSSVGISARMGLGDNWTTTFAYNEGVTRLGLATGAIVTDVDPLRSRAYGISVAKRNLFGDDTLGFALTRPLSIYRGGATLHAATGIDENRNLVFGTEHLSLAAKRPETDVELGYATRLMDGALMLQGSAAYQMDVLGEVGKSALAGMGRASLHF